MTDPMPRKDVELPPRMPEAAIIAELRAELAQARADTDAAAPVAWKYRWKIDGEYVGWRYSDASNAHPSLDGYEEVPLYDAPPAGVAKLAELRAEIERKDRAIEAWREDLTNERADRDRLAAELAASSAPEARLVEVLTYIGQYAGTSVLTGNGAAQMAREALAPTPPDTTWPKEEVAPGQFADVDPDSLGWHERRTMLPDGDARAVKARGE